MVCGDNLTGETTVGSTNNGDATGCGMGVGVWYKFEGTGETHTVTSDADGSFDHEMSVSSSSDCVGFTNVDCADTGFGGGVESITFLASLGTTYYIYVGHYCCTTEGTFSITIDVVGDCACAAPTVDYTVVPDCTNDEFSITVNVTALGDGPNVNITSAPLSNDSDSQTCVSTVMYTFGPYAKGADVVVTVDNGSCSDVSSTLREECLYDDCSNLVALRVGAGDCTPGATVVDLTNANNSLGLPVPCNAGFAGSGDLWFSVVLPASGTATLRTGQVVASSLTDTWVEVYESTCDGTEISCQDDDNYTSGGETKHEEVALTGTPGATLHIRIGAAAGSDGVGEFSVCVFTPCVAPAATYSVVEDCGNGQFYIDVNVSSTGTGSSVDISNNGGVGATTNVGTGVTQIGPFSGGTSVNVTVDATNYGGCAAAASSSMTGCACECTNCPAFFPDNAEDDFFVAISGAVDNDLTSNPIASVRMVFDHEYLGDLEIKLISPDCQEITLVGAVGLHGSTDFSTWDVMFKDGAVTPDAGKDAIWDSSDNWTTSTNYTGSYNPHSGNLSDFTGNVNGTWRFHVLDNQGSDVGNFTNFQIVFTDPAGIDCGSASCQVPSDIPTTTGLYTANQECDDAEGWTHYYYDGGTPDFCDDVLLLSIKKGASGAVITPSQVRVNVGNGADFYADGTSFVDNGAGWVFMDRAWDVDPSVQPSSPVDVRFYYTTAEFNSVNTGVTANSITVGWGGAHTDMVFYKVLTATDPWNLASLSVPDIIQLPNGSSSTSSWAYSPFRTHHYAQMQVAGFSGGGGGGGGGAIFPVELISFEGHAQGDYNLLEWATASEKNTERMIVERSTNGLDKWESIGEVAAFGTTNETQYYSLADTRPLNLGYYRLKSVDFDGQMDISKTVVIKRATKGFELTNLSPNPTDNILNIGVSSETETPTTLIIRDLTGREIERYTFETNSGDNNFSINMAGYANGIYLMTIVNNTQQLVEQIIKN